MVAKQHPEIMERLKIFDKFQSPLRQNPVQKRLIKDFNSTNSGTRMASVELLCSVFYPTYQSIKIHC